MVGAVTLAGSATVPVLLLGGAYEVAPSMAPKVVTKPIAIGTARQFGGVPALARIFAILGVVSGGRDRGGMQ
ncbi:LrgB family protein [Acetobacter sp. AN02]|nr:LrgB family protein [Acetobacter sp. AN02]